ncbi:metalloregulator ArsR/SmtB family transcription factor [Echinicola jeungdonensis]|uniref:ArsR/SmtB family transcription factor n=1 Tax=Echinicola jeungdonensis TaxID=709343 RepID=A0ABV5J7F6_9BACT|nr:metalloregulator ArsR/SmtB family transcription factor [Echinicola jeungdonensis]MDN3669071.1 metalloregulator ArsR/SmtB family transcription factor [Echinicola jeungdonensis]
METRRDVFQAIADPTRRGILSQLINRPQNLNSLASHFEMSRQAVSLHVKILEECEVIRIKKDGRERYCQLQPEKLAEIAIWMEPFQKMWRNRFQQLDDLLDPLLDPLNEQDDE